MRVGDSAAVTRTYSRADIARFAALAGVAADTIDAVPEPLLGALFSYLLGVELPGPGTNYLKQELRFHAPAPLGEALTATVAITRLRPDKNLCDLATSVTTSAGAIVASGRALVLVKDVARPIEAT
ncbi:MAG: phosphate acetyltransferase [Alphaproteobacteria bacterium]|nr:phosphate acetyltransferase [Alphaproteobacteria bacterium]